MSNFFGLNQKSSGVWVGEELTPDQIQFLDSVEYKNIQPAWQKLLEVNSDLGMISAAFRSEISTTIEESAEGFYVVRKVGTKQADFVSLSYTDAYNRACAIIDGR
jgi:hypothetical protein